MTWRPYWQHWRRPFSRRATWRSAALANGASEELWVRRIEIKGWIAAAAVGEGKTPYVFTIILPLPNFHGHPHSNLPTLDYLNFNRVKFNGAYHTVPCRYWRRSYSGNRTLYGNLLRLTCLTKCWSHEVGKTLMYVFEVGVMWCVDSGQLARCWHDVVDQMMMSSVDDLHWSVFLVDSNNRDQIHEQTNYWTTSKKT